MAEVIDDSLMTEYLAESREHLADIETDLLAMENMGANIDETLVNKVFRAAHSIKGGAGFFALHKIQELAHKMENVLDLVRSRELVPTAEVVNILLLAFDRLREMINNASGSNQTDVSEFVVALTGLVSTKLAKDKKASLTTAANIAPPGRSTALKASQFDLDRARRAGECVYLVEYDLIHDIQRKGKTPLDTMRSIGQCGTILDCAVDFTTAGSLDDEPANVLPMQVLVATVIDPALVSGLFEVEEKKIHLVQGVESAAVAVASEPTAATAPAVLPAAAPADSAVSASPAPEAGSRSATSASSQTSAKAAPAAAALADSSLRVSVSLLESLMNLAGELVLSRNQLVEAIAREDMRALAATGQRINLVTSELQETIMLTRMQPIGNIFNKFPRVVRDLANQLGKDIQLQVDGKDVEMDKTIIEGLSDPLTHMVRNAVDHGVEKPEVRVKAGKKPTGVVRLRAYHAAGQVVIEIADDGKGISTEKVVASALGKGLITKEQAAGMSEKEKIALIFLPGLSTAEKVTDVSGRGVGMDVVKTNLDKLGGKVEIDSQPGHGSTFRIKLPLTLAIIPSLLVSVEGERFAIPQVNVDELIRVRAEQVQRRIEVVGDAEVLQLRGELIPIVYLAEVLNVQRTYTAEDGSASQPDRRKHVADRRSARRGSAIGGATATAKATDDAVPAAGQSDRATPDRRYRADSDVNIVVVTAGSLQYGLIVDDLHDTVEIVVKPMGRHFKSLREYAGATILGDGRVALILDVAGVANKVELSSVTASTRAQELATETQREEGKEVQALLLFRNAPNEPCAVPLSLVSRVEQIQASQVNRIGGRCTLQYRGASLPLVSLADVADVDDISDKQDRVVIVFEIGGREIGLLAAKPVDVIETDATIDQTTLKQSGVMGSTILKDQTTLLVDIFELVETAAPDLMPEKRAQSPVAGEGAAGGGGATTILLAEDSDFFRSQVKRFLESDGHTVLAAPDGQAAWELLQKNAAKVQIIVTDIEMPRLTGLGLTQHVRADKRFGHLPIIALTSLASEDDIAKGKAAGVTEYQVKLDKESLLEAVRRQLSNAPARAAA